MLVQLGSTEVRFIEVRDVWSYAPEDLVRVRAYEETPGSEGPDELCNCADDTDQGRWILEITPYGLGEVQKFPLRKITNQPTWAGVDNASRAAGARQAVLDLTAFMRSSPSSGGGGGGVWGTITGTLNDQGDLKSALDLKADIASLGTAAASDVGDFDAAGDAAAAQAFAIQRANHTGTQVAATISDFNAAALAAAPDETDATVGAIINGATAKVTPVDTDLFTLFDGLLKKVTWANIKATLKTYFDTLYPNRTRVINTQVGTTYTLAATDDEGTTAMVRLNNGSAIALTFPENATVPIPVGFKARVKAVGAGQVTVTFAGATAVNSMGNAYKTAGQYAEFDVTKTATDTWAIDGNLTT